jgi:hypothetical protein
LSPRQGAIANTTTSTGRADVQAYRVEHEGAGPRARPPR